MATNNLLKVSSGAVPSDTINGSSAQSSDGGKMSPNGKLAAQPAGNGAELGGKIPGFGSGKPDASTINEVGGKVGRAPVAKPITEVAGFKSGLKSGKIGA